MSSGARIVVAVVGFLALTLLVGGAAGFAVKRDSGYRSIPAVAGFCCLGFAAIVFVIGDIATPQSACGGTGCDTGNGVGAMFVASIAYVPVLGGVWLGRSAQRRRRTDQAELAVATSTAHLQAAASATDAGTRRALKRMLVVVRWWFGGTYVLGGLGSVVAAPIMLAAGNGEGAGMLAGAPMLIGIGWLVHPWGLQRQRRRGRNRLRLPV